ncbi:MAG: hypothetical protein ACTSQF_12890 [Candidatus Heimdallarchaeaceae archaeon]
MFISKKTIVIVISVVIVSAVAIAPTVIIQINQNNSLNPITDMIDPRNLLDSSAPIDPNNNETEPVPFTETISIAGLNFSFENFLWRDFMPGFPSEPNGSCLLAAIYLKAINADEFPIENFTSERMWVFYQNETWETELELQEVGYPTPNSICLRADGGPKWGPNVYVNITLEIIYQGCTNYYISAFNQVIWKTV